MSGPVSERLVSWFVATPGERVERVPAHVERVPAAAPAPPCVAVLAARRDAAAVGAAAGMGLGRCAVVCTWSGEDGEAPVEMRVPAAPAVRRLAEALTQRGIKTCATGRLVRVALPAQEADAAATFRRAAAACGSVPVVLALGAARGPIFEALLAEQDRVVVAGRTGEDAFVALAAQRLGHHAVGTCVVDPTPAGRAMALAGAWVAPCLRPVAEAVA